MRVLLRPGPAKQGQVTDALAEHPQPCGERSTVEWLDGGVVGADTGPIDTGIPSAVASQAFYSCLASQPRRRAASSVADGSNSAW